MKQAKIEKFLIESTLIGLNNNINIDISNKIDTIRINKNFVDKSFPLFEIVCKFNENDLKLVNENNNIKINLSVYTYSNPIDQESDSDNILIPDKSSFNTILKVFKKNNYTPNNKLENDVDMTTSNIDTKYYIRFVCIPEDLLKFNNKILNVIYSDEKLDRVVIDLISSNTKNDLYYEKSDNEKRFENIIIPPMNLIPALRFIDDNYKLYKGRLSIFFDTDKTYIYNPYSIDRNFNKSIEIVTQNINNKKENDLAPIFDDQNNKITIHTSIEPTYTSDNNITNNMIGKTTVYNSYDDSYNNIKRINKSDIVDEDKIRYFWNDKKEQIFEESLNIESKFNENINIIVGNIDPSYFKPDTIITYSSEISDYANGSYIINDISTELKTDNNKNFICYNSLNLIKIKN